MEQAADKCLVRRALYGDVDESRFEVVVLPLQSKNKKKHLVLHYHEHSGLVSYQFHFPLNQNNREPTAVANVN